MSARPRGSCQAPGVVDVAVVPRSREVGQSWSSTVLSTARASVVSFRIVFRFTPDLVCAASANAPRR